MSVFTQVQKLYEVNLHFEPLICVHQGSVYLAQFHYLCFTCFQNFCQLRHFLKETVKELNGFISLSLLSLTTDFTLQVSIKEVLLQLIWLLQHYNWFSLDNFLTFRSLSTSEEWFSDELSLVSEKLDWFRRWPETWWQ